MNEALHANPRSELDQVALSTFRRTRQDAPAANDDRCIELPTVDAIDAWARHAAAANGFGDVPSEPADPDLRPATGHYATARAVRSQAMGMLISTALTHAWRLVERARARYREYGIARDTYRALRSLDDRTLRDLGYDRSEIASVAFEIASIQAQRAS